MDGNNHIKEMGLHESVALVAFVAMPLLLISIFELYPILWVNFLLGFVYASAALGFGIVRLVTLLGLTAIFWGVELEPSFVR